MLCDTPAVGEVRVVRHYYLAFGSAQYKLVRSSLSSSKALSAALCPRSPTTSECLYHHRRRWASCWTRCRIAPVAQRW